MKRSITFSNTALTVNKLRKISEMLDNNENVTRLEVRFSRKVKENKIKINDSHTFNKVNELIEYVETKNIKTLELLEFIIYYSGPNYTILKYDEFNHIWELTYDKQDVNIDSLIFNLKTMMKNNVIKIFRQYRSVSLSAISFIWLYLVLFLKTTPPIYMSGGYSVFCAIMILDALFVKNVPFRENRFVNRNKDSIILSIISYIIGVVTPYIIEFVAKLISSN